MTNMVEQEILNCGSIENYLYEQQNKILLRFLTCGSVDDGKSTLVGRLLHDAQQICEDQLSKLYQDSKRIGIKKNKLDLALLVDGLQSEREQGITIDVAYRYFFTHKRKFIIADTPGHEEYTKNMVTGASTSDVAVLLVDARKGMGKQTKLHFLISVLLGIKYIVVVVNKMDLIDYDQIIFNNICDEYLEYIKLFFNTDYNVNTEFIPIVALDGDNVVIPSVNMSWYDGPTLLAMLENIRINPVVHIESQKLRFPIQYVIRNHLDFRGYSGTVASGRMRVGQNIQIFPSNMNSVIQRIIISSKDRKYACAGDAVIVTVKDNIDISRGDMLIDAYENVESIRCALVDIVWMRHQELQEGQHFYVKIATKIITAKIENVQYQVDVNTLTQNRTNSIPLNGIGLIKVVFDEPLILDQYFFYPVTGSMIFIDFLTNETVGAGMVRTPIKNCDVAFNAGNYSRFELALHDLIRCHFPHWKIRDLP